MTAKPVRPAADYLRDDGRSTLMPGRIWARIFAMTDLHQRCIEHRGEDREFDEALLAARSAAYAPPADEGRVISADFRVVAGDSASWSDWTSSKQAAQRLGLTDRAVRYLCAKGQMPAVQTNGRWLIRADDLAEFARGRPAA